MTRTFLTLALCALLALATPVSATDMDLVVYLEEEGCLLAGLADPNIRVEGLNTVSFVVTPYTDFHRLRIAVELDPEGLELSTPAFGGKVYHRAHLQLFDAETDEPLWPTPLRIDGRGAATYQAPDERPVRIELSLTQGALVEYALRVSALRDPIIVDE